jgi:galactokinase
MVETEKLRNAFQELYDQTPRLFCAPGRVNLIGEHTDYNEGFVLPMAVDRHTLVAAAPTDDRRVRVHSLDLDDRAELDLDQAYRPGEQQWLTYVEGVARILDESGVRISGANLAISSDVPIGSGLSSSAALEMSVAIALVGLAGARIDLVKLALIAQRAEHIYAGAKVGVMDQLASAFGQKRRALLIDCRSLERTLIELNIGERAVVVCDTGVKHDLASSKYNQRREECSRGVELLREKLPDIVSLRDVSAAELDEYGELLPETIRRRCRHVVTENDRTLRAADALRHGEIAFFGKMMRESHQSLRDDYEVSCKELDIMVELALQLEGVVGARMTGGGFGGCTVNLVDRAVLDSFCDSIARNYQERTGIRASIYVVEAADGAKEIKGFE